MPRNTRRRLRYNELLARPDEQDTAAASVAESLAALTGIGLIARTSSGFFARSIKVDGDGLDLDFGDGVGGDPTLRLSDDLRAIENLATIGIAIRRAPDDWITRKLVAPSAGFTISNVDGVNGDLTFSLSNDLAALEALGSTGFATRTAANTWAQRSLALSAEADAFLAITNPAGIAANPTFDLDTQTANRMFAGPSSGGAAKPTFRALVSADIPDLSATYQPLDADLTAIAALTTTAYGRSLLTLADQAALRAAVGERIIPLFDHAVDVGNSTTTETDLYSDSIAAGRLATNGEKISAQYAGVFVSSGTATRQVRLYFGGTLIFDTGALTLSLSSAWDVYAEIIRVSSSVVRCAVSLTTQGAALAAYTAYTEVSGLTLADAQVMKITGQAAGVGAASNDIVAKLGNVAWIAAA